MQNTVKPKANTGFSEKNLIFVGGSPRSGTTLVQRILGAHPDIYGGPEFDLIPSIINLYQDHIVRIENGRIEKILSKADAKTAFQQLIIDLLRHKAEEQDARYFSEKTPSNSLVFEQLGELLPNSHRILVLRNPKAILKSMLAVAQRYKDDGEKLPDLIKTPVNCVKTIAEHQQKALQAVDQGHNIFIVYYEELTSNPKATSKALCEFLAIEYTEDMIALSEKKMDAAEGDEERWYTKEALKQGIINKADTAEKTQSGSYDYYNFLIEKYAPLTHPLLSRYKITAPKPKFMQYLFALREYATNGKKHRKFMRKN